MSFANVTSPAAAGACARKAAVPVTIAAIRVESRTIRGWQSLNITTSRGILHRPATVGGETRRWTCDYLQRRRPAMMCCLLVRVAHPQQLRVGPQAPEK